MTAKRKEREGDVAERSAFVVSHCLVFSLPLRCPNFLSSSSLLDDDVVVVVVVVVSFQSTASFSMLLLLSLLLQRGALPAIPPNADLLFDLTLLSAV